MKIELSPKQAEYIKKANSRYNFKIGAKGAGKSHVDFLYMIPQRIIERKGKPGLYVILGVTRETIESNILKPMRQYFGNTVGNISSRNTARLFGEEVYCLGAEKVSNVTKIQGKTVKYAYGDEPTRWHEEVFRTLEATLRTPESCFDGAANPEYPDHWLKKFVDRKDLDIYTQHYHIDDNPFYPTDQKEQLKKSYYGTIFYDRYILGEWIRADNVIYTQFANKPTAFRVEPDKIPRLVEVNVGVDFGGTNSSHAFVASGFTQNYRELYFLMSERHSAKDTTPTNVDKMTLDFIEKVIGKYGDVFRVHYDSAEQVLGRGIKTAIQSKYGNSISVRECLKPPIIDRIRLFTRLMGMGRFFITEDCKTLENALSTAVWDTKQNDVRLDDGSTPIDDIDAAEYSVNHRLRHFVQTS